METEFYPACVLWFREGRGVLVDIGGQTHLFRERRAVSARSSETAPVLPEDWIPKPREIVAFSIEYFEYKKDGRPGEVVTSVVPIDNFLQGDYEILMRLYADYEREQRQRRSLQRTA